MNPPLLAPGALLRARICPSLVRFNRLEIPIDHRIYSQYLPWNTNKLLDWTRGGTPERQLGFVVAVKYFPTVRAFRCPRGNSDSRYPALCRRFVNHPPSDSPLLLGPLRVLYRYTMCALRSRIRMRVTSEQCMAIWRLPKAQAPTGPEC